MSNTFYVDTNRQNSSIKSKDTNNEWEYKLTNNIQLPAGTEVQIQNSFLHKQGISGSTIEITEDIDETMYFSVYTMDNPQFVPKNSYLPDIRNNSMPTNHLRAFQPTLFPFGILNPKLVYNEKNLTDGVPANNAAARYGREIDPSTIEIDAGSTHNGGNYYNCPNFAQRTAMFDMYDNNPRIKGGQFGVLNDPYITGYTDQPLMAIYIDPDATYTDLIGDTFPTFNSSITLATSPEYEPLLADPRFKPYVKSVDIFIKAGVYSIGEISDLVENQVNGKYVNLKQKNDYFSDTITTKTNAGTFTGTLETEGIFTKAKALDRWGESPNAAPDEYEADGETPNTNLYRVLVQTTFRTLEQQKAAKGNANEPIELFPNRHQSGSGSMGRPENDHYALPYYPSTAEDDAQIIQNITYKTSATETATADVPKRLLAYNHKANNSVTPVGDILNVTPQNFAQGRTPKLPSKDTLFYIPVHLYNHLIKMWTMDDASGASFGATQNSYLFETGNWTLNTKRMFRYGFQTRLNFYGNSVCNNNGGDNGSNAPFIGLHVKQKTNSKADFFVIDNTDKSTAHGQTDPQTWNREQYHDAGVSVANYNYDIFEQGYYVGTPDFSFEYDSDMSAMKIGGLHQQKRMPSCDQEGNPFSNEGQTGLLMKRTSRSAEGIFTNPNRATDTIATFATPPNTPESIEYMRRWNIQGGKEGFETRIRNALNTNEDREGGVAVYNWAYKTALKYGDIKPETYRKYFNGVNGPTYKVYNDNNTHLWKFQDFFTTKEKALAAWDKTLWGRLGFTYDNLQNDESWEECGYYDLPKNSYSNEGETVAEQQKNTFYQENLKMYFKNEDFRLYGKTTKGDLGLDTAPTISTTFNSKNYRSQDYNRNNDGTTPPTDSKIPSLNQIVRTYGNADTSTPNYVFSSQVVASSYSDAVSKSLASNLGATFSGADKLYYPYINSMYFMKTQIPVNTETKYIIATKLPQLSEQGYYIITSDIVDGYMDDIKQGQPLPMLGIVPISNLSNQDFITTENTIVHTLQQTKNLNKIKIKILNPDLTAPRLLENSSVILRITTPLPQNTKMLSEHQDGEDPETRKQNPNPHDDKVKSR